MNLYEVRISGDGYQPDRLWVGASDVADASAKAEKRYKGMIGSSMAVQVESVVNKGPLVL